MKTLSSHHTALQYWRKHFPLDGDLGASASVSHAKACAHKKADVLDCVAEMYRLEDGSIDILVFDPRHRSSSKLLNCHVWSTPLPSNSFYRVHDMYVSSPEFVFLQMAQLLSVVQLVALGCELCGTYVLLPVSKPQMEGFENPPRRSAPLTSVHKLEKFLDAAKGARGLVKARRALCYVLEGSRSPMETMTAMQLHLPPLLGGYGLMRPALNPVIPLDDEARSIARRSWCEGDICWIEQKLDVEYNGDVHSGSRKMREDAGRVLGLEHMGFKVVTVTSPQVFDIDQFEVVAKEAAKVLKARLHKRVLGRTLARERLHEELESWMGIDQPSPN